MATNQPKSTDSATDPTKLRLSLEEKHALLWFAIKKGLSSICGVDPDLVRAGVELLKHEHESRASPSD